ncbi:WD40 containing domain protein [Mycena sanguinolenta]|uniref:WD40 containing domain protein n=1 Tax=Mycena sanguinolenta TaxID=230812 RepID=A0A8H7DHE6_9AGAR|nr:WD40 containing domain protein [Mycena sanguinolenta]
MATLEVLEATVEGVVCRVGSEGLDWVPVSGGMQFVIQNPPLDNVHQLAANAGLPGPSQTVAASSQLSASSVEATRTSHVSHQNMSSSQTAVCPESVNYCCQMLRQGRGFPLYEPKPQSNLPAEYQRRGVAIGDVGRVTPEGSFDFFFNIYLPANHPINANVPEGFVPLSPYDPIDVSHHDFEPGDFVSSSVTEISPEFPEFPGGEFVFSCGEPTGAVLALPHGAHLEKLHNLESMRRYAAKHAENWYKHVNRTRGRGLVNGSLYLVTGCKKPQSWGMASFHDISPQNEFQLSFRPTRGEDEGYRYRWRGRYCRRKQADLPPEDGTPLNHTTFIHAFAISVGEGIWEKLFGVEVCQPVDSSTFPDKSGRNFVPYGSQGSSSLWSFFTGGGAYNGGRQAPAAGLGNGIVTDAFPTPKIFHPSEIIHERILREVPQATVVITHDDDWRDVFKDDGMQTRRSTVSELQQAIFDRFEILEEDEELHSGPESLMDANKSALSPVTVQELESNPSSAASSADFRGKPDTPWVVAATGNPHSTPFSLSSSGGNGGGSGGQGGGGSGLDPSSGGVQFVIQNPALDNAHQLAANAGPPGPSQTVAASSQLSASAVEATWTSYGSRQNRASPQTRARGFPLYDPKPQPGLPAEYRRRGVAIGDVGRVAPEGSFDFFFNIYLPANHPINANVPEDFVPLSPYDPIDVSHHDLEPGNLRAKSDPTTSGNAYRTPSQAGFLPAFQYICLGSTISTDEPASTCCHILAPDLPPSEYILAICTTTSNIKPSAPVSAPEHILQAKKLA